MNRRDCLTLVGNLGLAAFAGCLSENDEGGITGTPSDAESPTASPTENSSTSTATPPVVSTPAPGECDARSVPHPSTGEELPDPRAYPKKPDEIATEPVREFLEEYEAVYRYNRRLAVLAADGNCIRNLDMYATESTVTSVENGITGMVTTRGSYTGDTCPGWTGTDTQTPFPHADLPDESAKYYVTERFLLRDGSTVECWGRTEANRSNDENSAIDDRS